MAHIHEDIIFPLAPRPFFPRGPAASEGLILPNKKTRTAKRLRDFRG